MTRIQKNISFILLYHVSKNKITSFYQPTDKMILVKLQRSTYFITAGSFTFLLMTVLLFSHMMNTKLQ